MTTDNMITPEQWESDWKIANERIERHTRRFDDINAFLLRADMVVQFYYWKQDKFSSLEWFKDYLQKLLEEYRVYFSLSDYKSMRAMEPRIAEIEEEYDELIYFWEYNPAKSRKERIETGMSIDEQRAKPKGLILRFQDAVKKVLE